MPDKFGDWLNQRDPNFDAYISLGNKKDKTSLAIFENYSGGVKTNRDAWCYNFGRSQLVKNINKTIEFYNSEVDRYTEEKSSLPIDEFIKYNSLFFTWDAANKTDLEKHKKYKFNQPSLRKSLYRPFTKESFYFSRELNNSTYQIPRIFPEENSENLVIAVTGRGATKEFSVLITNVIPDLEMISKGQCFPLYLYEKTPQNTSLFTQENESEEYQHKDAITDTALAHFQSAYPQASISKEDIFYYIYGLLHSEDYRDRYVNNLSKQLPRIPRVETYQDFVAFTQAGRELAQLHLNYENIPLYTEVQLTSSLKGLKITEQQILGGEDADFYVTQMKFANKEDKTRIIYNNKITIENIPEEAYDYVVNGKPALEWIIERQAVTTDKKSGITNDANDWAIETMGNAKYPLELFLRVITVSLKTQAIVNGLPRLTIQVDKLDQSPPLREKYFATSY